MLVPAVVFITLGKCNCCWNESLMVRTPLTFFSMLEDHADVIVFCICVFGSDSIIVSFYCFHPLRCLCFIP